MTFSMWLRTRRRLLAKVTGAILVAIAAGAAIGLAGATLTGDDNAPPPHERGAVRVKIVSAILHPAGTASGRSRQRARLSVHARITNSSGDASPFDPPLMQSGKTLLDIDKHAMDAAGALLRPVGSRTTADGVLRYETAGIVTRRLMSTRRVALRIAGQTIRANVRLGSPATRPG